jgi:hypothetical protein
MHDDVRPLIAKDSFKTPTLDVLFVKAGRPIDIPTFSRYEIVDNDDLMAFLDKPIN